MAGYFQDKVRRRAERVAMQALLRDLRRERGLIQQEVADRLGVPQVFVSNYETGERRLDLLELRAVLGALDVTLPEFLERLESQIIDLTD
jgi:transcriptional regulator with XRE-family HTH domain